MLLQKKWHMLFNKSFIDWYLSKEGIHLDSLASLQKTRFLITNISAWAQEAYVHMHYATTLISWLSEHKISGASKQLSILAEQVSASNIAVTTELKPQLSWSAPAWT